MASDKIYEQIVQRMDEKSTDELLSIWIENDRGLWSDKAFKAIESILINRNITLPPQGPKKPSVPQPQSRIGNWESPYISMAFFYLFLFWIGVLHPIFFFGGHYTNLLDSPLFPNMWATVTQLGRIQNRNVFFGFWQLLVFIELCLLCLGTFTGVLLWEKKRYAVIWTKTYLLLLFFFLNVAFLYFNFYSIFEEIIQIKTSIIDLSFDWNSILNEKISGRHWEYTERSFKSYLIPMACTIVWFLYFSKSTWVANRYSTPINPPQPS